MSHTDFRERFLAAAETIQTGAAPMISIEREARLRRRKRRSLVAGAAVVAVIAGGLAAGVIATKGPNAQLPPADDSVVNGQGECRPMVSSLSNGVDADLMLIDTDCQSTPLLAGPTNDYHPALSPDGTLVAFARTVDDGTALMVLDRRTGDLRQLDETSDTLGDPAFSPDGKTVAYWFNDGDGRSYVSTVPVQGGEPVRVSDSTDNEFWPDWSADGKTLAFARPPHLVTVNTVTGEETVLEQAPTGLGHPFWANNNGTPLLAVQPLTEDDPSTGFRLVLLNPDTGRVEQESKPYREWFLDAVWDDDGIRLASTLALGADTSTVRTLDYAFNEFHSITVDGQPTLVAKPTGTAIQGTTPNGLTYGSDSGLGPKPDLVAVSSQPVNGYSTEADLYGPSPASPEEALRWQENTASSYTVPAYDTDGLTIVGLFTLGEATGTSHLTTAQTPPPGAVTVQVDGELVIDGNCTYLDSGTDRRWLIWPWGVHLVNSVSLQDRDGKMIAADGDTLNLTASETPDQQTPVPCGTDLPPLYIGE